MAVVRLEYSSEFFNVKDTLECGQVFRFIPYEKGYAVFSLAKTCYAYNENDLAIIECEESDKDYFVNYFDLDRDYSKILKTASDYNIDLITNSARLGKGIRILNQDKFETLLSFIISQNNNIPRIKKTIEGLCSKFGDKIQGFKYTYHSFPSVEQLLGATDEDLKALGLGYRAPYIKSIVMAVQQGLNLDEIARLGDIELKEKLQSLLGVGPKVCDCVMLFGFRRTNSFPVDTWIEKVYLENMSGKQKDRKKIAQELSNKFGEYAGYVQQYLFYYKRSLENKQKID